jgi:predicted transcriptional regulator
MNANAEKIEIIQWVAGLDSKSILQQLKKMKDESDSKQQSNIDNLSQKELESILRGLDDSANGRVTPHSEVRKKYEKWL